LQGVPALDGRREAALVVESIEAVVGEQVQPKALACATNLDQADTGAGLASTARGSEKSKS